MIEIIPGARAELWPFAFSALLAGFYLVIAPSLPLRRTWARALVLGIALAVAVRYLAWRLRETLGPAGPPTLEGAWYIGVYLLEVANFVNYAVLFLVLSRRADRSGEADRHEAELRRRPAGRLPSVDVFIPTYNEGPEVVERSILAALRLDYPRFRVWVLDDGGRDWLAEFCAEHGASYVHRPDRCHAKAGNLNHGLSVSDGELFAIFDADFAPCRNFLYRTVGFFADPRIGIVQTPQYFFNQDPVQLNLGLSELIPDDQRIFFDVIAPSRDAWDCAFCCGSCSIQRRAAIEAVGGVPTESITEDILSTLVLLREGYITRYLDERLSNGLAAESLNGFFTQRQRWCRGAIQTLYLKAGPLGPGLTPFQRLLFFPFDWLFQYHARLLLLVIPILFLWTGVGPFVIPSVDDLIGYQLPAIVALASVFRLLAPDSHVPLISTAVSLFSSLRIAPTSLASLFKPFGVPFRVTPKGRNNAASGGDRLILVMLALLAALTVVGLFHGRATPERTGGGRAALLVAEAYACFNLILMAVAAVIAVERPRRRRGERFPVDRPGTCRSGGRDVPCGVVDISEVGALLRVAPRLAVGSVIELEVAGLAALPARVIRRSRAGTAVEFGRLSRSQRQQLLDFIYSSGLPNRPRRVDISRILIQFVRFLLVGDGRSPRGRDPVAQPESAEASPVGRPGPRPTPSAGHRGSKACRGRGARPGQLGG